MEVQAPATSASDPVSFQRAREAADHKPSAQFPTTHIEALKQFPGSWLPPRPALVVEDI